MFLQFGLGKLNYRHGKSSSSEYKAWNNMLSRCTNPNHPRYEDWGGRGVEVDPDWRDFKSFYEDMGDKPNPQYTLERKNNSLGYSKENCYWATTKEQALNRRSNVRLTYRDQSLTIREWADKLGISSVSISSRLRRGWSAKEALTGERGMTTRTLSAVFKHSEGVHSRKCEIYVRRNTYICKFTGDTFNKGVAYARPYK